jgi:thymidylate kinase
MMSARQTKHRGVWIALLGCDGAGKSAVIEQTSVALTSSFSSLRQFHLRPHFGLAEERPPVTNPHGMPARSLMVSLGKLLYLIADYWTGYWFLVRPRLNSAGLVIFDRYYHDMLVDPLRYRLPRSSSRLVRLAKYLIPRPDFFVFLDAPVDTLRQRKQELPIAELHRQRSAYLALARSLPNAIVIDATATIPHIVEQLANRLHTLPSDQPETSMEIPEIVAD